MPVADKISALFQVLTQEELDAMPPAQRRRFADLCRHWCQCAELAARRVEVPRSGVLQALRHWRGHE
jgi:hypothetical protein